MSKAKKENTPVRQKLSVHQIEIKSQNTAFEQFKDWSHDKKVPLPTEKKGRGNAPYVTWGKQNDYPLFVNTLYEESPSQTGIINGKTYLMTSGGYTITLDNPADQQQQLLLAEFEANARTQYTLGEIIYDMVRDGELYNGRVIRGVWNETASRPAFLEYMDFDHIRTDENESCYWYSKDWSCGIQSYEKTGLRMIPRLDFAQKIPGGEFIIYIPTRGKQVNKGTLNVYPRPPYTGCIKAIMTEVEHESFDLYEVQNGFKTGTVITVPNPKVESEEELDELADKIREGATDRDAAGGVLVLFTEGGANIPPQVLQLNGNNLPERYLNVSKKTSETIIRGHTIPSVSLFGIAIEGKLGSQQEIEAAFEIMKNTYIPARQKIYNYTFTWIMRNLYGIQGTFKMNPPAPLFSTPAQQQVQNSITIHNSGMIKAEHTEECEAHDDEFLARDPVLKEFAKFGRSKSQFLYAKTIQVPHEPEADWFESNEQEMLSVLKVEKLYFAKLITETQAKILQLIEGGNDVPTISKALDISVQKTMNTYVELSNKGLVRKDGKLSAQGKRYLLTEEAPTEEFEILYSYEKRPGVKGNEILPTTRNFCRELINMDRLYTRKEIDAISRAVGRDVWKYKGGWWQPKGETEPKPFCRHGWEQHLVIKKRKKQYN